MSWIATVTKFLPWIGNIIGSIFTGRDRKAEMEHEETMAELNKGRIPVKHLRIYVSIGLAVFAVVWSILGAFCYEWWPDMPPELRVVLQALPLLLGIGG